MFPISSGDRLYLRPSWSRDPNPGQDTERGAGVRQHGHRQGRGHQPRGVHHLLLQQPKRPQQPQCSALKSRYFDVIRS